MSEPQTVNIIEFAAEGCREYLLAAEYEAAKKFYEGRHPDQDLIDWCAANGCRYEKNTYGLWTLELIYKGAISPVQLQELFKLRQERLPVMLALYVRTE